MRKKKAVPGLPAYKVVLLERKHLICDVEPGDASTPEEALKVALDASEYAEEYLGTSDFRVFDWESGNVLYEDNDAARERELKLAAELIESLSFLERVNRTIPNPPLARLEAIAELLHRYRIELLRG